MKLKIAVAVALVIFFGTITVLVAANQLSRPGSTAAPSKKDKEVGTSQSDSPISVSEVKKHATVDDCWLIIGTDVYDVTSFINSHPGGKDRIINQCGKDATTAFETQDGHGTHSASARSQLDSFQIGALRSGD